LVERSLNSLTDRIIQALIFDYLLEFLQLRPEPLYIVGEIPDLRCGIGVFAKKGIAYIFVFDQS
jgi:hypothetical protein